MAAKQGVRKARTELFWKVAGSPWTTGGLGIVLAWLGVWVLLPLRYPDRAVAGQVGDSFGLITSLFSGLTLLGAGYAVYAQNEQLNLARQQARDSDVERRENQRIQESQARAQRAASELNAYDALVRQHLDPVMNKGIIMSHQVERYQLMTRVILMEIQNPDGEFDWGVTPVRERTRFRKFLLYRIREARDMYDEFYKKHPNRFEMVTLMREVHNDFHYTLLLGLAAGTDREWARLAKDRAIYIFNSSVKQPGIPEVSDETIREQVEDYLYRFPENLPE